MLTYLFTVVFGLIFGWMTMNNVEEYWTDTYYRRYKRDKAQEDMELAERERIKQENDSASADSGNDILDSSMGTCDLSNNNIEMVVDSDFSDYCFLGRAVNTGDSTAASTNSVCKENI